MKKISKNYVCVLMKTKGRPELVCGSVYDGNFLCAFYDKEDRKRGNVLHIIASDDPKVVAQDLANSIFRERIGEIITPTKDIDLEYFIGHPIGQKGLYKFASDCLDEITRQKSTSR